MAYGYVQCTIVLANDNKEHLWNSQVVAHLGRDSHKGTVHTRPAAPLHAPLKKLPPDSEASTSKSKSDGSAEDESDSSSSSDDGASSDNDLSPTDPTDPTNLTDLTDPTDPTDPVSEFSPEELRLFETRFENGFIIYTDEKYLAWLQLFQPDFSFPSIADSFASVNSLEESECYYVQVL